MITENVQDLLDAGHVGLVWSIGIDIYNEGVAYDGEDVVFATSEDEADKLMKHYATPDGVVELLGKTVCVDIAGIELGEVVEVQWRPGDLSEEGIHTERTDWNEQFVKQADGTFERYDFIEKASRHVYDVFLAYLGQSERSTNERNRL